MDKDKLIEELCSALRAAMEWIDAVPEEAAAAFPSMPGFDRDWVESLLADHPDEDG